MGEKGKIEKRERLAAELRANLKRRKDQVRSRSKRVETGGASGAGASRPDIERPERS